MPETLKNEGKPCDFRFCHANIQEGRTCLTKGKFVFAKEDMAHLFVLNRNSNPSNPNVPRTVKIWFCTKTCADAWSQDQVYDKEIQEDVP